MHVSRGSRNGSESCWLPRQWKDGKFVNPKMMSKYRTRGECLGRCTRAELHRMLSSDWESPHPEEEDLQHPIAGRSKTSFHYWVPSEANPEAHTGTLYELCDLEKDNLSRPQFPLFRKIKDCLLSSVQLPHPVTFDGRDSFPFCHLHYPWAASPGSLLTVSTIFLFHYQMWAWYWLLSSFYSHKIT